MAKTKIALCTCGARAVARIGFGRFCRECASEAISTAPAPTYPIDYAAPTLYDVATAIAQRKAEANGFAETAAWLRGETS
jgi:hypothetical protein